MNVTVVIPVGPYPANTLWLNDAILTASRQLHVDEVLLISDDAESLTDYMGLSEWVTIYKAPWHVGVATAFNFGVALAKNELVFFLGSDDWLEPDCIGECVKEYLKMPEKERAACYFYVPLRYQGGGLLDGEIQRVPANAALVTKSLWKRCGGFPLVPEAPDAALLEILRKFPGLGGLQRVGKRALYNHRIHPDQETLLMRKIGAEIGGVTLNGSPIDLPSLMRVYAAAKWKEHNDGSRGS